MARHQIWFSEHFKKEIKSYHKKYFHLIDDIYETLDGFDKRRVDSLGKSVYKIRLRSRDLGRGKNKSFRLIVFFLEIDQLLIPLTIYFKGDKVNIFLSEINYHLSLTIAELEMREK